MATLTPVGFVTGAENDRLATSIFIVIPTIQFFGQNFLAHSGRLSHHNRLTRSLVPPPIPPNPTAIGCTRALETSALYTLQNQRSVDISPQEMITPTPEINFSHKEITPSPEAMTNKLTETKLSREEMTRCGMEINFCRKEMIFCANEIGIYGAEIGNRRRENELSSPRNNHHTTFSILS